MNTQKYITAREAEECKKVAAIFNELYNQTDILVINSGEHGFVLLKYNNYMTGYFSITTYTNSVDLFDALWSEWAKEQLISLALNTPLIDLDYEEIFASLPEKEKKKILDKKDYFRLKLQQVNIYEDFVTVNNSYDYITLEEKERCKIVADIFYESLAKDDLIICDAGKYGYAMLTYYKPPIGFDGIMMFTDSQKMYNTLLQEWYTSRIEELAKVMNMSNLDVDVFYERLSDKQKAPLIQQRQQFIAKAKKTAYFINTTLQLYK